MLYTNPVSWAISDLLDCRTHLKIKCLQWNMDIKAHHNFQILELLHSITLKITLNMTVIEGKYTLIL